MPGAFTHIGFADQAKAVPSIAELYPQIFSHPQEYYWGSQGPDPLFFHPSDWPFLEDYFGKLAAFYQVLRDTHDFFNRVDGYIGRARDWATGGLYSDIERYALALQSTTAAMAAVFIAGHYDVFQHITPPMHRDATVGNRQNWHWIELAHHYRTGDFLSNLLSSAESDAEVAYCVGYATHVCSDVVGHPYVNLLSGGSYRNHWRRHIYVEKCLDTHFWNYWHRESLSNSNAYERFSFAFDNQTLNLPASFKSHLASALSQTYGDVKGAVTTDEVDFMYDSYFRFYLKSTSSFSLLNLPPPEDFDWLDLPDEVTRHFDDLMSRRPSIGLPRDSSEGSIKRFLQNLSENVLWYAEFAVTIATLSVALLATLATAPLRFLLWLLLNAIYEIYYHLRLILAYGGLIHPEPSMIRPHFEDIVYPSDHLLGLYREIYPYERYWNDAQTYHLLHPFVVNAITIGSPIATETPLSQASLLDTGYSWPDFLFGNDGDANRISQLMSVDQLTDLNQIESHFHGTGPVSSTALLKALIQRMSTGSRIPNWNLDGDRGYGWPNWHTTSSKPWSSSSVFAVDNS